MKDQEIFYSALKSILTSNHLKSNIKNLELSKITKDDVFIEKDYRKLKIKDNTLNESIQNVLDLFKCNYQFAAGKLQQYIDGLIINHPILGTRIIEFDEEQHFNPFRLATLQMIDYERLNLKFKKDYLKICNDIVCINSMLNKHRIKSKLIQVPSLEEFILLIKSNNKLSNKYLSHKNEFSYFGGRIAQRAYFDLLRDIIHLAPENKWFSPCIRISKNKIERIGELEINKIPKNKLLEIIEEEIREQSF